MLISIRELSRRNLFFYFLGLCLENRAKNRFHAEISESNRGKFAEGDSEVAPNAHTLSFSEISTLSSERGEKIRNLHCLQKFLLSR